MPLTPEDVANKQFTSTRLKPGYDETEVDEFLDEVEAELTRLYRETDALRSQLAAAQRSGAAEGEGPASSPTAPPAQAAPAPAPSAPAGSSPAEASPAERGPSQSTAADAAEGATGILALAQRTADEHIAQARTQSERIVGEARNRAETLKREADDRHRQLIGSMESERTTLDRKVEELRTFERDYRARLKSYLEEQLRDLQNRPPAAPDQGRGRSSGPQQADRSPSPFASGAPVGQPAGSPSGPPQQAEDGEG